MKANTTERKRKIELTRDERVAVVTALENLAVQFLMNGRDDLAEAVNELKAKFE